MQNVIYLDVLLLLNLFVNYFLFLSTALLIHYKPKRLRFMIGSAVGSLFSLMILFDPIPVWLTTLIKLPLGALLVWIAFGASSKVMYFKLTLTFFAVNFVFGGVVFAVWMLFSPSGMYMNNGVVYFHISALTLLFGTLAAYLVIRIVGYLFDHKVQKRTVRRFVISVDGKEVVLSGLIDTGHHLSDAAGGLPVVVCELSGVASILPSDLVECFRSGGMRGVESLEIHSWSSRIRMIPYTTIGKGGVMMAFRPDRFYLLSRDGKAETEKEVLIGVTEQVLSQGEYQAVLPTVCM